MKKQTSFNRTGSSSPCSLSYPGGGKGKQRDIGHLPKTNKIAMAKKIILFDYFPRVAASQYGNRPTIKFLSIHHVPTLISSLENFHVTSLSIQMPNKINLSLDHRFSANVFQNPQFISSFSTKILHSQQQTSKIKSYMKPKSQLFQEQ